MLPFLYHLFTTYVAREEEYLKNVAKEITLNNVKGATKYSLPMNKKEKEID